MYARIVGTTGLIIIAVLFISECRSLRNSPPLFMGETQDTTGFVIAIRGSSRFEKALLEVRYKYYFDGKEYTGAAVKRGYLAKAQKGDSLLIEVSKRYPSRSYAIATYPIVGEF